MSITVQLLPTSLGDASQVQPLTSFLLNETISLDAGCVGFVLPPERLARVEHVVLTHAHLDHTLSLPFAIDAAYPLLTRPMCIYGTAATLTAMRKNLLNDDVWVDFSKFNLIGTQTPCLEFKTIAPNEPFEINGLKFTPVPVHHPVPTVGFIVESPSAAVVFGADSWRTEALWQAAAKVPNLKAVFIECSFPDEMDELAEQAGHLTPKLVVEETSKIGRKTAVHCTHLKPSFREKILPQLAAHAGRGIAVAEVGKVYRWD